MFPYWLLHDNESSEMRRCEPTGQINGESDAAGATKRRAWDAKSIFR